ncbi:hypothetical protein PVAND_011780 [Polypedilum vanderplanki]|uniref:Uncharacterized protein n=1 Tax=Polypedilum vanderplanki TaxID=319348 RepID=A0A9J6CLA0_POLVA|nr:hypothetical protein PVAND_011780 [Polypedilum vanderplanki]
MALVKNSKSNISTFDMIKKEIEKQNVLKDVKPIIKPRKFIEPGTIIDLEDCINTTFDDAKEAFRQQIKKGELQNIERRIDSMVAMKKKKAQFEEIESASIEFSNKHDHLEKLLRNDHSEMSIFTKLASEITLEENSVPLP